MNMTVDKSRKAEERYREALASIPPPGIGKGCHLFLLAVANHGVHAGHDNATILADIRAAIPPGRRRVPDSDIRSTLLRARRDQRQWQSEGFQQRRTHHATHVQPELDGCGYRQKLIDRSAGVSDVDLWEVSPVKLDWEPGSRDAIVLLEELYAADEILFLGERYDRDVKTVEEWLRDLVAKPGTPWPHIMPNPVDGDLHETATGTESRRGDAAIRDLRYVLVEFDDMVIGDQYAFWHTIIHDAILPVTTLIYSGSKSLHAWIRVDIPHQAAWDEIVRHELYGPTGRLTLLGADRACCNPARLSRLPGYFRTDKDNWQRIVYLNPDAYLAQD